jgi:hypothetical protein
LIFIVSEKFLKRQRINAASSQGAIWNEKMVKAGENPN